MSMLFSPRYFPEPTDAEALSPTPTPRDAGPLGVLMINLGTPDAPTAPAIRRYLREFLSDPRVIELPALLWQPILRGLVLTRRPKKLVPRYETIWMEEGSPLLVWTERQAKALQARLQAQGVNARVAVAMRYGQPSVAHGMDALKAAACERILVLPMYPQYAASPTATAIDRATAYAAKRRNQPELRWIKRYHTHPGYINALATQIEQVWAQHGVPDRLLLSYHSLPQITVEKGDPYHRDCMETSQALRERLGSEGHRVYVSFQSRFGAQKWLQPFTEPTLKSWAQEGIKHVQVACPGFTADCLETLEEIDVEGREAFLQAGGEQFHYIPCLNANEDFVEMLAALTLENIQGWF